VNDVGDTVLSTVSDGFLVAVIVAEAVAEVEPAELPPDADAVLVNDPLSTSVWVTTLVP